ncbi:hypothetical protein ACEPAI_452 [Sanghuangporus weigelae]
MVAVDENGPGDKVIDEKKRSDGRSSSDVIDTPELVREPTKSTLGDNDDQKPTRSQLLSYDPAPWYLRVPFCPTSAPPSKHTIETAPVLPEASASIFSLLFFDWITDLLRLGYSRPLEANDLYKLQDSRNAKVIADQITRSFQRRLDKANAYNERLQNGEITPGFIKRLWWSCKGNRKEREKKWREEDGKRRASLVMALNDAVAFRFWFAGILKVIADSSQMCSPLLVKAIINFAKEAYSSRHGGDPNDNPPIGRGIGLAIGLLFLQALSFFCTSHFMYRAGTTGVLLRGGLITAIYNRSLHLSTRARSTLTNGKLVNHISTDVSRIDFACQFFHFMWSAPIQMLLCLALLLVNLGPSALAGYAFFVLLTPLLTKAMRLLFKLRKKSMVWTDKRAKLLQELLGGIKVIKFFAWEVPFLKRIAEYRHHEIYYIRSLLILRSANNAVAFTLPVFASVLSFVAYSLSGHSLDPAVIFSSLTLFQLLRLPLMFFPVAVSAVTDAANATGRLHDVFVAELLEEHFKSDPELDVAVRVNSASFTWDSPPPEAEDPKKKRKGKKEQKAIVLDEEKTENRDKVFTVRDIDLEIPRGSLVAIVGPVGSGKSSLLQGLIGEMRRTSGSVQFGGSVAYCPQTAWIQNASIRENICFGRPFDEERYWRAVRDSCLERDLELLPHYDQTEVGEKGISLSGGQKQRVNICRAIYCNTDIQIFDDPLSALDAHVGKAVFQRVLQNGQDGKTRILITHALHFLPYVDYIYVMLDGRIVERGRYSELMSSNGAFSKFVQEFGNDENEDSGDKLDEEFGPEQDGDKKRRTEAAGASLMQAEERVTGAVSGAVYAAYFRAGRGRLVLPLLLFGLVMVQASSIMSSYWLVYWQANTFNIPQGAYMGIYAGLGLSQAFWFFGSGAMFAFLSYFASKTLHLRAIERVMHAPMTFFETTPLGRIMNRFAKDIDTIDNVLSEEMRMFANTFSQMIGAIVLISIVVPWFLIAMAFVIVMYYFMALFYRSSARELKRLDSLLRSSVYSHFSESLSGLATIRAYGETGRFLAENECRIDIENRAYWLTVVNQHWLALRLNCLGGLLTFIVAILTVATRFTISPAQTGVALSYIVLVQQSFAWMVRQSAEVENDMNGVERIVHYATSVEQESPHEVDDFRPPPEWPSEGEVEFRDIVLKYRPELPPVLKGISMSIKGGEKIGIVGRTGAGKSSIMVALYRLVELFGGSILIDGVDISKLGLRDLRSNIAIIPQDPLLFSGTLRSNLDPFGLHDDARLWDALKRSYLVEDTKPGSLEYSTEDEGGSGAQTPIKRLTLDSPVEDEGGNLSVGQRSLVSLARALVKDSKILVLDEATASVDYETDRNIQDTIAREFKDRTILCIAHRLRTIISYDRICVLDAGRIAEFDTPSNLYQREDGIFRGMCTQSSIAWDDIRLAAKAKGYV